MSVAQYVYVALMAISGALASAAATGALPPTTVAWLLVLGSAINGLLPVLKPTPPTDSKPGAP